jgi:hypothetical protein
MFRDQKSLTFQPLQTGKSPLAFTSDGLIDMNRLDGLNKPMNDWDKAYYINMYNLQCLSMRM